MLTASSTDGPAFHTRSHTQNTSSSTTSTPHLDTVPQISQEPTTAPKPLTVDCLEALLQICISKRLLNGKALTMNLILLLMSKDYYINMSWMLVKSSLLALVIPKSWKYTVLMEAHDKLGHQGNSCTYSLIKCQYYWKGMNKDIRKYVANCVLC